MFSSQGSKKGKMKIGDSVKHKEWKYLITDWDRDHGIVVSEPDNPKKDYITVYWAGLKLLTVELIKDLEERVYVSY